MRELAQCDACDHLAASQPESLVRVQLYWDTKQPLRCSHAITSVVLGGSLAKREPVVHSAASWHPIPSTKAAHRSRRR